MTDQRDPLAAALAWADLTMNDRLREARRTGTDGDYEDKVEWCIDTLAAEVRRLQAEIASYGDGHLCHPTRSMASGSGGVCAHCGRTLHASLDYDDDLAKAEAALAAERIENAHLREAFVTMERAYNANEGALATLRQRHSVMCGCGLTGTVHVCEEGRCAECEHDAFVLVSKDLQQAEAALAALKEQHDADVERAYAAGVTFTATSTDQMAAGLGKWNDYKRAWARRKP